MTGRWSFDGLFSNPEMGRVALGSFVVATGMRSGNSMVMPTPKIQKLIDEAKTFDEWKRLVDGWHGAGTVEGMLLEPSPRFLEMLKERFGMTEDGK